MTQNSLPWEMAPWTLLDLSALSSFSLDLSNYSASPTDHTRLTQQEGKTAKAEEPCRSVCAFPMRWQQQGHRCCYLSDTHSSADATTTPKVWWPLMTTGDVPTFSWKEISTCWSAWVMLHAEKHYLQGQGIQLTWEEYLPIIPNIWKPGVQFLASHKPDVELCAWNPSSQIVESWGLKIQDHPQLYDKFKASWGYIRLSLKTSNTNTNFSFVKMINTSGIKRIALALCVLFPRMGVLIGIQAPALSPSWPDRATPLLLCPHLGVASLLTSLSLCPRCRN